MSNNEISKTLKALYELRFMRAELEDEITALEDKVKSEMNCGKVSGDFQYFHFLNPEVAYNKEGGIAYFI